MSKIKASERTAIIQSLRSGQTPRTGLAHIQVGRAREIDQISEDLSIAGSGGAAIRFVIGDYGTGKTFFLNLAKHNALQKGFVVLSADLTSERRLHGTDGQAVALYSELMRNASTRNRADGSALKSIIEKFIDSAVAEGEKSDTSTRSIIRTRLEPLQDLVSGFDFADVLNAYYDAYEAHDEVRQTAALKWLRGEFTSKTDARNVLGVRSIVEDDNIYNQLKLIAAFCVISGYRGLMVQLDEMVTIHNLTQAPTRLQNYEKILRIMNDIHQGSAEHLMVMMGGVPEFLEDTRRGIYSHDALRTRLAPNSFAREGLVDLGHPVMRLSQLTSVDLRKLLDNIRSVFSDPEVEPRIIEDDEIELFISEQKKRQGSVTFQTPRETIKQFTGLLSILKQNPGSSARELILQNSSGVLKSSNKPGLDSIHATLTHTENGLAELESLRL